MKRFKNVLVGVDLSQGNRFAAEQLSAPNAEAVRQALWLAKLNSASVHFLFSLDLSARAWQWITDSGMDESGILEKAESRLAELVTKARKVGVAAESHVVVGKSWVELIRHAILGKHDLVLVGTRHVSAGQGLLLGSTGIKLLRKCPCPVWVTKLHPSRRIASILVAHDLRPVGDLAMELGCSMAGLQDAQLHVLHAAEYPEFDYMFPARISAEDVAAYRRDAEQHIAAQLADVKLARSAQVHLVTEPPAAAILDYIKRHDVELLVMGTVGRAGISGLITGNTAERLLPRIPCSVLAVKPTGFESPVRLLPG